MISDLLFFVSFLVIIVSVEVFLFFNVCFVEKWWQLWIIGCYKMFNVGIDDLFKNIFGKLKSFFYCVI